jgi:hypothetical protein
MLRARRLIDGLRASGLIELDTKKRSPERFVLTSTGISLRAARATKRLTRVRAETAVSKLLEVVAQINGDPIFLHDIAAVFLFGSYIGKDGDLGDIDVAVRLRARWRPGLGADSDRERRKAAFEATYLPPETFYERHWWRSWPETYTKRLLKTDPAMVIIESTELENLGCPYRQIYPRTKNFRAKPGWSFERQEIILQAAR